MFETISTVISGVFVLVLGQIALKSVVEPIQEFYRIKGEIAHSVTYYSNIGGRIEDLYIQNIQKLEGADDETSKLARERLKQNIENVWRKRDEATVYLRNLASRLRASVSIIPFYQVWVTLNILPPKTDIVEASSAVIGMSNSVNPDSNMGVHITRVAELLNLTVT